MRWVLPEPEESISDERTWVQVHDEGYDQIYSVGEDAALRSRIVDVALSESASTILIAGCGSRIDLQRDLLTSGPADLQVACADYEPVVALARKVFDHPRLSYVAVGDREALPENVDSVVAVNSVVSGSDLENRRLLREWSALLRPGGRLISLMPILSCGIEWTQLVRSDAFEGFLDVARSSWFEDRQSVSQVEYLPLRLRRILREASLTLERLEIVFLDDQHSRAELERVYRIVDSDISVYEQLIVARR